MKILISGISGQVGSYIVDKLAEHDMFALSRTGDDVTGNITVIKVDMSKPIDTSILPDEIDIIIHLAQSEFFRDFPGSSSEIFSVNTLSTLALADYAIQAKAKKFIYASSGGVYGHNGIFNEDEKIIANNHLGFYLGTKLCSEIILESYERFFDVVILRPFFVYSPLQNNTMLIPRLISSVKNKQEIKLDGDSGIRINPIYANDAAEAIAKACYVIGSHKINIAGDEIVSIRELSELIGCLLDEKPIFVKHSEESYDLIGNNEKMKEILCAPKISLESGIKKCIGIDKHDK